MKIALKLTASFLIAALCLTFAVGIFARQVEFVIKTMGYGLPLLMVPFSWLPIAIAVVLGLALRKWWVAASLPFFLIIKYVPPAVLAMIVANDTQKDIATMSYSTEALPRVTEYTRFRTRGTSATVDNHDRQALLSSEVNRIVVVVPKAWNRRSIPLESVNLAESEVQEFRRVKIDQCPSKEYLRLPIETDPDTAACVLPVPFTGELPAHALFQIERETEEAREYAFTFAQLQHQPAAKDDASGETFVIHPELEILQKSRKVKAAAYLPQPWLLRKFWADWDVDVGKKNFTNWAMTKRYPERDFGKIYTEIFPPRADFVASPAPDQYTPLKNPEQFRKEYQKITATRKAEDWLATLQDYHDRYMQNVSDASQADIYKRLRLPSLILCHGGQYSALTVSILTEFEANTYDCLDGVPKELAEVQEKRSAEIARREALQQRLEDLQEQRRLSLADGFPSERLSAGSTSRTRRLYLTGLSGIDRHSVADDLQLAVRIPPGTTPYEAELSAAFNIPEDIELAQYLTLSCDGMPDLPLSGPMKVKYSRGRKVSRGEVSLQLTDAARSKLKTGLASGKCTLDYGSTLYQYSTKLPVGREFHILQGLQAIDAANRNLDELRETEKELATLE